MNVDTVSSIASLYVPSGTRPRGLWPKTQALVGDLVAASTQSPSNAAKYLSHLADFAAWAYVEGIPLTERHLLDFDVIERYVAIGMGGHRDSTRATRRAVLRRIARRCNPAGAEVPVPIAYRRVRPPYTEPETDGFLALAATQPTPSRRRNLAAILHLGLGCGLASQDLAWVRRDDVRRHSDGSLTVTVSGGTRPRPVTALRRHEDALEALSDAVDGRLLIGGQVRGRRNVTRGPLDDVVGGEDLPRLETARLRSTWLLTHLRANTPVPALMQAAGLTTVRPLEDLLHLCPIDGEQAQAALRGA